MDIETIDVTKLTFDANNARKHSPRNLQAIVKSLQEFGQRKPIVVTHDNVVIAGNGTLEAAITLGWKEINITRTPKNWTLEQSRAYALADNRTAELAEWDSEVLFNMLNTIEATDLLVATGFDEMDMRAFAQIYGDMPEADNGITTDRNTDVDEVKITLTVNSATKARWNEAWKFFEGDDNARLNNLLDALGIEEKE